MRSVIVSLPSPARLLLVSLFLLRPGIVPAAPEKAVLSDEEKLLKEAGLPTDGPGLLDYFRRRTLSQADRERLASLVRQLGNRSFARRERASEALVAVGEAALPFLAPALHDEDPEIVRRARLCLDEIEKIPHAANHLTAARLLVVRAPEEAAAVLLGYLPFADWEAVGEPLLEPLKTVGLKKTGKKTEPVPLILAAVKDQEPTRRAAAAYLLGYTTGAPRDLLRRLLTDGHPLVRFHAAVALLRQHDSRGVPALVALVGEGPLSLAWQADDLLYRVAGERNPPVAPADPATVEGRKKWRAVWEDWWRTNREKVDLARVSLEQPNLGLTMTCEIDGLGQYKGRVSAFDRSGSLRWSIEGLESPSDFQPLPNGRVLVAEHWAKRITERDRKGTILWERKVDNMPVSCERLRGGNTLIATYSEILEITPEGKTVFSYKHTNGMVYCACKLRTGNILFIDSAGRVGELDRTGKQVRTFTPQAHASGAAYWASIEPLPGGHYLICLSGAGKLVETDAAGKILWEGSVPSCIWATRLPNGNTLVANADGRTIVEVDRQGKEVWKKTTRGRPFRVRRY
jgi:HEAT repeat protein